MYEILHRVGTAGRTLYCLTETPSILRNAYWAKLATISTELFESIVARPGLPGFFENAVGDRSVRVC